MQKRWLSLFWFSVGDFFAAIYDKTVRVGY